MCFDSRVCVRIGEMFLDCMGCVWIGWSVFELEEAVADLEILSWGGQILIYFLIVVLLCY